MSRQTRSPLRTLAEVGVLLLFEEQPDEQHPHNGQEGAKDGDPERLLADEADLLEVNVHARFHDLNPPVLPMNSQIDGRCERA